MRPFRTLRYISEYAVFRAVVFVLRLLPIDQAAVLGGASCALVAPWTGLHRRAKANIAVAFPELTEKERRRILAGMWRHTGRTIAETLLIDRLVAERHRIEIVGQADLCQALHASKSNISMTLHFGNWELCALGAGACGLPMTGIYRPMRNYLLDRYMQAMRQPLYAGGLVYKGMPRGRRLVGRSSRVLVDCVREGRVLGFVCDQTDEETRFTVDFFGRKAKFSVAPVMLARRLGAQLWIGRCIRVSSSARFRLEVKKLPVPETDDRDADVRAATAAMARQFEDWIRESPEQWMWWQRRSMGEIAP